MLRNLLIRSDASEACDRLMDCLSSLGMVGSQKALLVHVLNVRDIGGLYQNVQALGPAATRTTETVP